MFDRGAGLADEKRQAAVGAFDRLREHRRPRGVGGTLSGRVLRMWNVAMPLWSEDAGWSRWADRKGC
jgi:hypothetical protein